jgi:hypothetical protein
MSATSEFAFGPAIIDAFRANKRHHAGNDWKTLTIPRGHSEQFNRDNCGAKGS